MALHQHTHTSNYIIEELPDGEKDWVSTMEDDIELQKLSDSS